MTSKYIISDTCSIRKLSHLGDFLYSDRFKAEYEIAITQTIKGELRFQRQVHLLDKFTILEDDDGYNSALEDLKENLDRSISSERLPKKNDLTILSTAIAEGYDLVTNDDPLGQLTKLVKEEFYDNDETPIETFKAEVIIIELHNKELLDDNQVKEFVRNCNEEGPYTASEFNEFFNRFED